MQESFMGILEYLFQKMKNPRELNFVGISLARVQDPILA